MEKYDKYDKYAKYDNYDNYAKYDKYDNYDKYDKYDKCDKHHIVHQTGQCNDPLLITMWCDDPQIQWSSSDQNPHDEGPTHITTWHYH